MNKKLEELKLLTQNVSESSPQNISQKIYRLLMQEKANIDALVDTVYKKRREKLFSVKFSEPISEQQQEISLLPQGINEQPLHFAAHRFLNKKEVSDDYKISLNDPLIKKILQSMRRFYMNGPQDSMLQNPQFWITAFSKKPEGVVTMYEFQEECYLHEFSANMGCANMQEMEQTFAPLAMNFSQLQYLYHSKKLPRHECYRSFLFFDGKLIPIGITFREEEYVWYITEHFSKGDKFLLFTPKMEDK